MNSSAITFAGLKISLHNYQQSSEYETNFFLLKWFNLKIGREGEKERDAKRWDERDEMRLFDIGICLLHGVS